MLKPIWDRLRWYNRPSDGTDLFAVSRFGSGMERRLSACCGRASSDGSTAVVPCPDSLLRLLEGIPPTVAIPQALGLQ